MKKQVFTSPETQTQVQAQISNQGEKKMKKMLFAMAMCGMLVACSSTTEDTSTSEEVKKEETKP